MTCVVAPFLSTAGFTSNMVVGTSCSVVTSYLVTGSSLWSSGRCSAGARDLADVIAALLIMAGTSFNYEVKQLTSEVAAGEAFGASVYEDGEFAVEFFRINRSKNETKTQTVCNEARGSKVPVNGVPRTPCRPLLVAVPVSNSDALSCPVLMLLHGFSLVNSYYSQLMGHIASHGYIVVAPQMYDFTGPDTTKEALEAAEIVQWMKEGQMQGFFPQRVANVEPDCGNLVLLGHSRGGKVVWQLALDALPESPYRALIGLDPVAGMSVNQQTNPPILSLVKHGFNLKIPSLIVGSGLGPKPLLFLPPCAPLGVSHDQFFLESAPPAYHIVASEFGHMDFLDDHLEGFKRVLCRVCARGPARKHMRIFTGGLVVAYLKAILMGISAPFNEILQNPSSAPIKLEPPESIL